MGERGRKNGNVITWIQERKLIFNLECVAHLKSLILSVNVPLQIGKLSPTFPPSLYFFNIACSLDSPSHPQYNDDKYSLCHSSVIYISLAPLLCSVGWSIETSCRDRYKYIYSANEWVLKMLCEEEGLSVSMSKIWLSFEMIDCM